MTEVASSLPMQMTLVDVARLARVQRPVVSVWRGRSAASAAPFPEPFAFVHGEERFDADADADADAVVAWLELTERGNNPAVRKAVAAFASPKGMSAQDDEIVFNGLAALLCLKEIAGESLAGLTDDDPCLPKPLHSVWPVLLLEPVQVCLGERHIECAQRIVKVLYFGGSDNGCSDSWLVQ